MAPDLKQALADFQACVVDRNAELARATLDDDYALMLVVPVEATVPRDRWLAVLPDYLVEHYVVDEMQVDEDEDVAVVLQKVRMQATVLGEDRSGTFVITDVWRRRARGWRIWRRHSTPLIAGPMPGM